MNKRKTIRSLMLTLVFAMTLAACSFISVSATAGDGTVNVDFGSKHVDYAKAVCKRMDAKYEATVTGSILTFNLEPGNRYDAAEGVLNNALPENLFDKEELLYSPINFKPADKYEDHDAWGIDHAHLETTFVDNSITMYAQWFKRTDVSLKIKPPACGTKVTFSDGIVSPVPEISIVKGNVIMSREGPFWYDPDKRGPYTGTMKGDMTYNAQVMIVADFPYYIDMDNITIENGELDPEESWTEISAALLNIKVKAVHDWDEGKVTKDPTTTEEGVRTYTCKACGATKTEAIPKIKPSPAPAAAGPLLAKMTAKGKTSMKITWNKVKGAQGYDIYLSRCNYNGKKLSPKKVKTIKGNKTLKWTKKRLRANTAYKGYVRAWKKVNGKKKYFRTSLTVHAFTAGGDSRLTNSKAVTVKKKSVTLSKGKTYRIKASVKKLQAGKKLIGTDHTKKLRYVSSNKKVATVSKSGKITAKGKGSCKVYAVAASGAKAAVKVTVK